DACEETSILMVDRFYQEQTQIGLEEAKKAIVNILNIKEAEFGPSYDENAFKITQMVDLIHSNWSATLQEDPTLEQILNELNQKRPVIAPIHAPELNNPYYTGEGPDYHVIVLIGFDATRKVFITHDPGTRNGAALEFSYEVMMEAIHDLNTQDY